MIRYSISNNRYLDMNFMQRLVFPAKICIKSFQSAILSLIIHVLQQKHKLSISTVISALTHKSPCRLIVEKNKHMFKLPPRFRQRLFYRLIEKYPWGDTVRDVVRSYSPTLQYTTTTNISIKSWLFLRFYYCYGYLFLSYNILLSYFVVFKMTFYSINIWFYFKNNFPWHNLFLVFTSRIQ